MDKAEHYRDLKAEIDSVVAGETSVTARYATAACILAQAMAPRFFWTGFYVVDPLKEAELVVGPYQGTLGCLRIPFGKGVCGHVAATGEPIIVADGSGSTFSAMSRGASTSVTMSIRSLSFSSRMSSLRARSSRCGSSG